MCVEKSTCTKNRLRLAFSVLVIICLIAALCFISFTRRSSHGPQFPLCAIGSEQNDVASAIKKFTGCNDNFAVFKSEKRGDFRVLYNYVVSLKRFQCEESVTYATHGDYPFLGNLSPLLERWRGPISLSLHAPGTDFKSTLDSIAYLRSCTPLVKEFVTFHIYFNESHAPEEIPSVENVLEMTFDCSHPAPFANVDRKQMYRSKNNLTYPINVGRNVARLTSETHFLLMSDIELYPSPDVIPQFLKLIASCEKVVNSYKPEVFVFPIFEVESGAKVPNNKSELKEMLQKGVAIPFHHEICTECHSVPYFDKWKEVSLTDGKLNIFSSGKRNGKFYHWEPIYIGTNAEPEYDERLSWEGMSDKIVQGYTLCLLDYSFLILDNAFLVHKPGIKKSNPKEKLWRGKMVNDTNRLINDVLVPEVESTYGKRNGCIL